MDVCIYIYRCCEWKVLRELFIGRVWVSDVNGAMIKKGEGGGGRE